MRNFSDEMVGKKIKFDDDGNTDQVPVDRPTLDELPKDDNNNLPSTEDSDSDSDSDDAPEEESVAVSKQKIISQQQQLKDLTKQQSLIEKEKRRIHDLHNKQQQELKSAKEKKLDVEVPDILPDDIINAATQAPTPVTTKPSKHKRLDNDDVDNVELARQIKLQKLKSLKNTSIKKGPVHVVVAQTTKGVPKAEKVINSRDKWLKRKSLGKK